MSKTATWGKQKLNSSASKQQEQGCLLRRKESGALPAQAQSSHGAQPQLPEQGREPGTAESQALTASGPRERLTKAKSYT